LAREEARARDERFESKQAAINVQRHQEDMRVEDIQRMIASHHLAGGGAAVAPAAAPASDAGIHNRHKKAGAGAASISALSPRGGLGGRAWQTTMPATSSSTIPSSHCLSTD